MDLSIFQSRRWVRIRIDSWRPERIRVGYRRFLRRIPVKGVLCNPRLNQLVRIRYAAGYAHLMPLHDMIGIIRVVGNGRPRNHGVEVQGRMYAIPAGNLMKG